MWYRILSGSLAALLILFAGSVWYENAQFRVSTPPSSMRHGPSLASTDCSWQSLQAPELGLCSGATIRPGAVTFAYHRDPEFMILCHGLNDYVSSGCRNDGNFFESSSSRWMGAVLTSARAARAGDALCNGTSVVWYLDVGANIGLHALHSAALGFPTLALEMMLGSAARLSCSKLVNRFEHLAVRRIGVGATRIHACAENPTEGNVGGTKLFIPMSDECVGSLTSVEVLPLDNILDDFYASLGRRLPPPALMKIDCEGCEWGVLSGLARHISTGWRPSVIFIETSSKMASSTVGARADDPLDGSQSVKVTTVAMLMRFLPLGYRVWTGDMAEELTQSLKIAHTELDRDSLSGILDEAAVKRGCQVYLLALAEMPRLPTPDNGCKEFRRQ
jgi:FkbM family methyltransferase